MVALHMSEARVGLVGRARRLRRPQEHLCAHTRLRAAHTAAPRARGDRTCVTDSSAVIERISAEQAKRGAAMSILESCGSRGSSAICVCVCVCGGGGGHT